MATDEQCPYAFPRLNVKVLFSICGLESLMGISTTSKRSWAHIDPNIMRHPHGAIDGKVAPRDKQQGHEV